VEKHPLIDLRYSEQAAGFLCRPSLDITQNDNLTLTGWQGLDRLLRELPNLGEKITHIIIPDPCTLVGVTYCSAGHSNSKKLSKGERRREKRRVFLVE